LLQTLFHIPTEIAGLPLFGVGLLLVVWCAMSVGIMAWLVRRQGLNGDTLGYIPLLLIVAAAIVWVLPALAKPEGLPIRGYGVMMLIAVVSATALALWRARRVGVGAEVIYGLALWLFVPGIVGARLFYIIEYWPTQYWPIYEHQGFGPLLGALVNVAEGGLVVYGSLIGGLLGLILFTRHYRLPLLAVADLIAPSMALGLALGRIGCLLNGCCYGGPCEHGWAVTFPPGSPPYQAQIARGEMAGFRFDEDVHDPPVVRKVIPGSPADQSGLRAGDRLEAINGYQTPTTGDAQAILAALLPEQKPLVLEVAERGSLTLPSITLPPRSHPIHPTQIYSSLNALLICLVLLAFDRFRRHDGQLFALMLTLYPISRFVLEIIRTDETSVFGTGMSISQNVSLVVLAVAAGLWVYTALVGPGRAFAPGKPGR